MLKTTVEILLDAGYEIDQVCPMDDGRFEIVLTREEQRVTLLTDEHPQEEYHRDDIEFIDVFPKQR